MVRPGAGPPPGGGRRGCLVAGSQGPHQQRITHENTLVDSEGPRLKRHRPAGALGLGNPDQRFYLNLLGQRPVGAGLLCASRQPQLLLEANLHVARIHSSDARMTGNRWLLVDGGYAPDASALLQRTVYQQVGTSDSPGTNSTPTGGVRESDYLGTVDTSNRLRLHLVGLRVRKSSPKREPAAGGTLRGWAIPDASRQNPRPNSGQSRQSPPPETLPPSRIA